MTDLRFAGLVSGTAADASLTPLGEATLAAWQANDIANAAKADELPRVLLLLIAARQLGVPTYQSYSRYWDELRTYFPPAQMIHNWDKLYLLNYLDNEIGGYAPGTAYRDMGVPLNLIQYDLDRFVEEAGGSAAAKAGAERVQSAIDGKVPRARARATFCLAMELLTGPNVPPRALLKAFGHPRKPKSWTPFAEAEIAKIEEILDISGFLPAPSAALLGLDQAAPADPALPYSLPAQIDFSKVLRPPPEVPARKSVTRIAGPKKTDYTGRQEHNALVGALGEEFATRYEAWRLRDHHDLRGRVVQVSLEDDTLGYDIASWETDGSKRLVEVKSTLGPIETRFYISATELACARSNPATYVLLRVGNLKGAPVCCELRYPFDELQIEPVGYEMRFKSN